MSTPWQGPCSDNPRAWDIDDEDNPQADLATWLRSRRICLEQCPFLAQCQEKRDQDFPPAGRGPAGVIWAGVAYSLDGHPLDRRLLHQIAARARSKRQQRSPEMRCG